MSRIGNVTLAIVALLLSGANASRAQSTPALLTQGMTQGMHEGMAKKKAVVAEQLSLTVDGKTQTLRAQDLQAMLQRSVTVHNGHTQQDEVYTGVGVDELLKKVGLTLDNGGAAKVYHSYVRAEGTDHYFVVYSASELEPTQHTGDSIVALTLNGKSLGEEGQFKLVVAGEKKPSRWVRNLATLKVVTVE